MVSIEFPGSASARTFGEMAQLPSRADGIGAALRQTGETLYVLPRDMQKLLEQLNSVPYRINDCG